MPKRGLDREEANASNPVPYNGSDGSSFHMPLHHLKQLDLVGQPAWIFPSPTTRAQDSAWAIPAKSRTFPVREDYRGAE